MLLVGKIPPMIRGKFLKTWLPCHFLLDLHTLLSPKSSVSHHLSRADHLKIWGRTIEKKGMDNYQVMWGLK